MVGAVAQIIRCISNLLREADTEDLKIEIMSEGGDGEIILITATRKSKISKIQVRWSETIEVWPNQLYFWLIKQLRELIDLIDSVRIFPGGVM